MALISGCLGVLWDHIRHDHRNDAEHCSRESGDSDEPYCGRAASPRSYSTISRMDYRVSYFEKLKKNVKKEIL